MDSLAELRELAPPGPSPPAPDPWASPRRLPADFMALAAEWGPGRFGGFLWLLAPGAADRNLAVEHHANTKLRALREVQEGGDAVPYEIDRLLPWAVTDNGDVLYWRAEGAPQHWTVVINEAGGPDWHAFAGGAAAWLAAWLAGRERPPLFPVDVPGDEGFEPA